MKKRFVLLPTLLLALLLTACGAASAPEEDYGPEILPVDPPVQETETEEQTEQALFFVVELSDTSGKVDAQDGTPLVEYAFQVPQMTVRQEDGATLIEGGTEREEAALAVAAAFNERFAEWRSPAMIMGLAEPAEADLNGCRESGMEWRGPHEYTLECTVYQTEGLVSISGLYCAGTGGAHPNTCLMGWNFDLINGAFIGADALVGREDLRTAVTEELLRQAEEKAKQEGVAAEELFWPEYASILADWSSYAVTFDAEGMNVSYSPYELAAYAAGAQVFRVDYELMRPCLDAEGLEILGLN